MGDPIDRTGKSVHDATRQKMGGSKHPGDILTGDKMSGHQFTIGSLTRMFIPYTIICSIIIK